MLGIAFVLLGTNFVQVPFNLRTELQFAISELNCDSKCVWLAVSDGLVNFKLWFLCCPGTPQ